MTSTETHDHADCVHADVNCGEVGAIPDVPFLTGVGGGQWHAISRESMAYLRTGPADSVAFAECGELVRVALKFGAYDRLTVPVLYHPCHTCAWTVAAQTDALDVEVSLLMPEARERAALAQVLPDPLFAAKVAQALVTRAARYEDDYGTENLVQLLAAVSAHAPVQLMSEDCAEGGCSHEGYCPGSVACRACSLQSGEWAGEWAGTFLSECTIPAPCPVLVALAGHAGVGFGGRSVTASSVPAARQGDPAKD